MVSSDQELEVWSSCSSSASVTSVDPVNYWKSLLQNTFTRFRTSLDTQGIKNLYFMFDLDRFELDLLELLDTSRHYAACGIEINGFTSFVDNVIDFFNYVIKIDYLKDRETLHHIKLVLDLFRPIAKLLLRGHEDRVFNDTAFEELKGSNNRPCLVRKDFQELENMIKIREDHEANLDILLTKFFAFYIDDATKPWFHILIRLLVFSILPFPTCLQMFNAEHVNSSFRKLCKTASSETPLKALSFYDSFLAKQVFSLITYNPKTIVKTIWIHGQERWSIAKDHLGVIDNRDNPKSKYQLRCRLITHSRQANEHGVVVFFCHGGGMILFGPECHELYTKRFVENLGGAALFCPDYTLKAVYPVAFQEILDSYLWLTSGHSSVTKKLGFRPRKIIIAGDSAGGVLGLGLLNILHQIEIIDSNLELVFPSDLVFFYGAFLLNSLSSPSRTTTLFEPVLSEGILLIIGGCIGGIEGGCDRKLVPDSRVMSFVSNLWEELSLFKHFFSSRITTPWYLTDTGLDVPAINKLLSNLSSTLFYSLNNFNFQRFAYTRLYLFTTVKCIFLDDNADLARAWQGPVELHVARKLSHGFLMVPGERRAFQYSVDLLKKAIARALED